MKIISHCFDWVLTWAITIYVFSPFLYIFFIYLGVMD